MNAVEIEEAISALAAEPFDGDEFPYAFLEAFGNKATTIKRLRAGSSNKSDLGGVLQTSNIHIKICAAGEVTETLAALRASGATTRAKAKFVLATDGNEFQAEDLASGEVVVCGYPDFPNHFGFFLPLAGISTVKQIRESAFDIRATSRLNRLYVELLKDNPDWGTAERRHDMNHFMARLIFCFFAEDTDILHPNYGFTLMVERMSASDSSNTHEVIGEIFRAMNTKTEDKAKANLPRWVDGFPYVNGGLFSGSTDVPRFSRIARSYLLHIGNLDWKQINPDIFGSMIQAVADDDERGALGMHYTSVPNILKVLNPLFLDDLREKLEEADDNTRKLRNLRNRMARIRVFDPACGSGNFLVIAYKEMRAIEAEINKRCGDADRRTEIPLTNFRGIELRDFPAEIARLALIIAEYQCDVLYRGQKEALAEFLPLDAMNWITCGNALRLDWLSICPPTGTGVKHHADDLFMSPLDQAQIDFENEGGETYICGNPPYKGNARKTEEQKDDLKFLLDGKFEKWGLLDYVCGWFVKAYEFSKITPTKFAFVATNSVAQGQHVSNFWKPLFDGGLRFFFAVRSFKWANLAAHGAGVTVVIIGCDLEKGGAILFDDDVKLDTANINGYLLAQPDFWVTASTKPIAGLQPMIKGNYYGLSEHILMDQARMLELKRDGLPECYIRRFYGSTEVINAKTRYCLWFVDEPGEEILQIADLRERIQAGVEKRKKSKDAISNGMVNRPHQFREMNAARCNTIAIPVVSSENRDFLPTDLLGKGGVLSNKCFALFDAPLWNMALIASRLHWVWIGTVCVRMRTDFSYSNTLGWNTFPVPKLTEKNKEDLARCAEDILLAREAHFPATIADLYDPEKMPDDLRAAHDRNDETLERIYIGRRFRNDTERLEKLFELYTKMSKKGAA
ncbi:class I SAM-dependent DNA methyltransferase [Thalassospira lucentensis]|uniref:class I SAM-dependent DNA methyltransferase n=1 Tax=Thalassospira lucentensis TaxID=168935 RepID=UPI00142DD691|nr:class I SAM-dependent DNA methyltransferase [Thalassospira lucentensis]NIZ01926.1 class I SAM-dependent DNA methyltransferase [Thalassospira lucentensis]